MITTTSTNKLIDLRSDTVTQPTQEMREAMANAIVGDDVYEDDPTVIELEKYAAELVGKEAALFVPSGTFANQLALFTHCHQGDEVILDDGCHIVIHEVGASGVISGVQFRTIECSHGQMPIEKIIARIRKTGDIHEPRTGLICLENAHSNGRVLPFTYLEQVRQIANTYSIPIHMDGARLFNAATASGVNVKDITQYADSVMFCLSKGLCAPIGSILTGSKEFIASARKKRKLMGGGLRQVGILAAAGLIALKDMTLRLSEDHENAQYLAQRLVEINKVSVNPAEVDINMVFCKASETLMKSCSPEKMQDFFKKNNILINPPTDDGELRLVTHNGISKDDLDEFIDVLGKL